MENIKETLLELASLSDVRCKHSAIVVDAQGDIVAKGYNHKIQGGLSTHAEVACLRSIEDLSVIRGSTLIVARMRKDVPDGFHLSKPCLHCENVLRKFRKRGLLCVLFSVKCEPKDDIQLALLEGYRNSSMSTRLLKHRFSAF